MSASQYAVIKDAATPAELEHARSLLWADLQATHSWDRNDPRTWTDASFDNPTGGTTNALEHATFIWYVRTLPGVLAGFAVAYDTDDLVAVRAAVLCCLHGWLSRVWRLESRISCVPKSRRGTARVLLKHRRTHV
jgi:hypothetical protein